MKKKDFLDHLYDNPPLRVAIFFYLEFGYKYFTFVKPMRPFLFGKPTSGI